MILQLLELIPVTTPLGKGHAIVLEATAHDYYWTVALSTGALVTFTQDKIRICNSYSHGRGVTDKRMKGITV